MARRYPSAVTEADNLLTPSEVGHLFKVDPKTVTRWAKNGMIPTVKTLGGHRRYPEAAVRALLEATRGSDQR